MLIEFRLENYRSVRDEQVLSMEAAPRLGEEADPRPRRVDGHHERLLTVAVLYGANASGKSNVLAGLAFMREAVLESHRAWSPEDEGGVPRDPFAWGAKRDEPSLFEVTILLSGVKYQYGFVVSDSVILEEWLFAWPKGKKQVWFEREAGKPIKFGANLVGQNKLIEGITRGNSLFLSAAIQNNHLQLKPIYSWFHLLQLINISICNSNHCEQIPDDLLLASLLDGKTIDLYQFLSFLSNDSKEFEVWAESAQKLLRSWIRESDLGILDIRVKPRASETGFKGQKRPSFELKHQSELEDTWLPLDEESQGTKTMIRIAVPIVSALLNGSTVIVDELEASLHPSLAIEIVRQFNDPITNPHNAQLIFTTHDTNLMGDAPLGEPVLRRDQIWLTEKDKEGATVLYPLTDYKPRKAENLERGYLQGRYGAIPFLGEFSLAPE